MEGTNYLFILLILCSLLLPSSIFAQAYPYLFETKDKLIRKEKTLNYAKYAEQNDECRYEILGSQQMIYLYRKYYCQSEHVDFQYVRVGQDSFYYSKFANDSLNQQIEYGLYIFGKPNAVVDSVEMVSPDTYKEVLRIDTIHFQKKRKAGSWTEFYKDGYSKGHYTDGKKDGTWVTVDRKARSRKKLNYKNGTLIDEKEQNLVLTDISLDELTWILIEHEWYFDHFDGDILDLYRAGRRKVQFNKDGAFLLKISCGLPPERHWNVIDNKMLCIGDTSFKILWLSNDYVKLRKIER